MRLDQDRRRGVVSVAPHAPKTNESHGGRGLANSDNCQMKIVIGPDGVQYPVTPAVERFLGLLDHTALSTLVLELASYNPEAMRSLQLRAATDEGPALRQLVTDIDAALEGVDFDFHDPFYDDEADDGVQAVEDVIDELERHLETGAHGVVRQALQHLLTRLGVLGEDADNADTLEGVAERASELFGHAVGGHPEPAGLARWVVGFRTKYRGWPSLTLDAVAAAFDEHAWATYRVSVAALVGGGQRADPYRSEVDRMLLELADHDGDVDGAVALLSGSEHPYYGEIISRLRAVGREAEVLDWLDRAVAHGSVDFVWQSVPRIVAAEDAAWVYLNAGRSDAALAVPRTLFNRDLTVNAYQLLCEVAQKCGCLQEQRVWALEQATKRASRMGGAHLIKLHLTDGDTEGAWEAADVFGADEAWTQLVAASEDTFPLRAGQMCLTQAQDQLTTPNSKHYPHIVALLAKARSLHGKAGHRSEVDAEIARLREIYRRRPALMKEMNRARLPA